MVLICIFAYLGSNVSVFVESKKSMFISMILQLLAPYIILIIITCTTRIMSSHYLCKAALQDSNLIRIDHSLYNVYTVINVKALELIISYLAMN